MVTFIIPTIGRDTLDVAISSIKAQTRPCQHLVARDSTGQGPGPTRNSVADQVQTPWVAFLDDDDAISPHYVEWLEEEMQDNDVVIFRMQYMRQVLSRPAGEVVPSRQNPTLFHGNVGISFAMKTEIFRRHPFAEDRPGTNEDWEMIKTLLNAGYKIHISDRVAYWVRP